MEWRQTTRLCTYYPYCIACGDARDQTHTPHRHTPQRFNLNKLVDTLLKSSTKAGIIPCPIRKFDLRGVHFECQSGIGMLEVIVQKIPHLLELRDEGRMLCLSCNGINYALVRQERFQSSSTAFLQSMCWTATAARQCCTLMHGWDPSKPACCGQCSASSMLCSATHPSLCCTVFGCKNGHGTQYTKTETSAWYVQTLSKVWHFLCRYLTRFNHSWSNC